MASDPPGARRDRRRGRMVCDVVAGVEPGLFENGLDAGFDFVGDVAVDLDDAPVEAVTEASGLGDFGDAGGAHGAVGGEPGTAVQAVVDFEVAGPGPPPPIVEPSSSTWPVTRAPGNRSPPSRAALWQ